MSSVEIEVILTRPITESCTVVVTGDPDQIEIDKAANDALDALYEDEVGNIDWQTDDNSEGETHATNYRILNTTTREWGKWIDIEPKTEPPTDHPKCSNTPCDRPATHMIDDPETGGAYPLCTLCADAFNWGSTYPGITAITLDAYNDQERALEKEDDNEQ